jgi:hypothetical protein
MGGWNLLHGGEIVGSEFCYHTIPEKLDPYDYDAFTRYGTPFYAVCTNIETGQPEYLRIKDMLKEVDLMRASASMPFVSKIVEFDGKKTPRRRLLRQHPGPGFPENGLQEKRRRPHPQRRLRKRPDECKNDPCLLPQISRICKGTGASP